MLAATDRDDRAGDPPGAVADQERRQCADIVHQMLLGRGRAKLRATSGRVWWKAVLKQTTCGKPGRAAGIGARLAGMCRGSSGVSACSKASVIRSGAM